MVESVNNKITFKVLLPQADRAMKTRENGGIDLTPADMNLQTRLEDSRFSGNDSTGGGIKFHLDPAMLEQVRNASGFVPVIISVEPMKDLRGFLLNK